MFRFIVYILILCFAHIAWIYAADTCPDETNITCANFELDLSNMDPVGGGKKIDAWQWGVEVLTILIWSLSDLFLFIIPIIAAISFLAAGYFYIFSAGDSEKVGRAKTIIKWNVIAILVAFLSYSIIRLVALLFAT